MNIFKNPQWIKEFEYLYASFDQIPAHVFIGINERPDKVQSENPLVNFVISASNEELDISKKVGCLAKNIAGISFD